LIIGNRTRFTTNPGESFTSIGTLPSFSASPRTAATVESLVRMPRTTSTSFISGTGLKKCRPTNCAGRLMYEASFVMERLDVFVAMMLSSPTTASMRWRRSRFRS
jgi:hypothetical protein